MDNVFQFRSRDEVEFDQQLEALEMRMADVRKFHFLSRSQQETLLLTQQINLVDAVGRVAVEATEAYERALIFFG